MPQLKSSSYPRWYAYGVGLLVVLILGGIWLKVVYLNPQQVFWGMIRNSLSTQSVTTEISQGSGGSAMRQLLQVDLGTTRLVRGYTDLKENSSEVKTEMIGTPTADYSEYLSIKTNDKGTNGKSIDTSGILNIWAKSDTQTGSQSSQHLFAQALLGVSLGDVPIPVGDLTPTEVSQLVTQMQQGDAYNVSFDSKGVSEAFKNGRLLYTYHLKVEPVSYLGAMKTFASDMGLSDLNSVNPNNYVETPALQVTLTVDAASRQLVAVNTGQGYVQSYEAYGVPVEATVPAHPISAAALAAKISKLQ